MKANRAELIGPDSKNLGSYDIECADTFFKRFMGLMGRDELPLGQGLWFDATSSIHMCFMRFPIDVVWVRKPKKNGWALVTGVSRNVRPWRLAFGPRGTYGCIEVPAGTVPMGLIRVHFSNVLYRPALEEAVAGEVVEKPDDLHFGGAAAETFGK